MDFLVTLLELVVSAIALAIYGRGDRPRHAVQRLIFRCFMLMIYGAAWAVLINGPGETDWAMTVFYIAAFGGMILLMAEHEIGDRRIAIVAWVLAAPLAVLAIGRIVVL